MSVGKLFVTNTLLSMVMLGFITACNDKPGSRTHKSKTINVHIATVKRTGLKEQQFITGSIQAFSTVRIYNQESGRIKNLPVYPGDRVEKNQLIAILDDALLSREFEKAQAQHKQTKLDLKRLKRLIPRKLASDEQLARALTLVEQARAEENLFKTRLSYSKILAPMHGVITERLRETGDVVPLHSHILSIADISRLKITLSLSELTISQLNENMSISIRVDALGDSLFTGKILRIHPTIDNASRQGKIEIIFDEVPKGALPGQLCRIEINTITAPRLVLPVAAIRNDSIGEFVFKIDKENKAEKTRIKTGIQINNQVEIISGLKLNDKVVTRGFQDLSKNIKVKIIQQDVDKPSIKSPVKNQHG